MLDLQLRRSLAELLVVHPDNQHVLSAAMQGKQGPAVAFIITGISPLYSASVVFHTARYEPTRWIYHLDKDGKLWLPDIQPKILMSIRPPCLSAKGGTWRAL